MWIDARDWPFWGQGDGCDGSLGGGVAGLTGAAFQKSQKQLGEASQN